MHTSYLTLQHRRHLLVALTATLVFGSRPLRAAEAAGVGDQPRKPSRCNTSLEDRNLANLQAYIGLLTSGKFNEAMGYFAPNAVVVAYGSVPFAGTHSVNNGAWGALQQQYWDLSAVVTQDEPVYYADCDKVILNGPFRRVARTTGRTVDTRVIEYFTFDKEGKIARDDFFLVDTAAVNAALGV
jgi:SnoaL-like domain